MNNRLFCIYAAMTLAAVSCFGQRSNRIIGVPPTSTSSTMLRDKEGVFGAPRGDGKTHSGVDIVANRSTMDKEQYRVRAVADGMVAYAKFNGLDGGTEGYGYTVIIDHQNGTYTLYAHLATFASGNLVKVGDRVNSGQVIGYMADLANGETSSGNVIANSVERWDKIQLHFEEFQAPEGRWKLRAGAIHDIKENGEILNPTSDLVTHGYKHATAQSHAVFVPPRQQPYKPPLSPATERWRTSEGLRPGQYHSEWIVKFDGTPFSCPPSSAFSANCTATASGDSRTVKRYQSSDGNLCTFNGMASGDSITGSYTCTKYPGPYAWQATIIH